MRIPHETSSDGSERMTEIDGLSARVETLEVRSAYQDQTIEALNTMITEQ